MLVFGIRVRRVFNALKMYREVERITGNPVVSFALLHQAISGIMNARHIKNIHDAGSFIFSKDLDMDQGV